METSTSPQTDASKTREPAVHYVHTSNVPALFTEQNISLIVSTYQAQRIMTLAPNGAKLSMLMRVLPRPTGMAVSPQKLAVCSRNQVWTFGRVNNLRNEDGDLLPYDLCYTPRSSHVTGDIAGHEMAWIDDKLLVLNTRFSCLCELEPGSSFKPIWQPSFITELKAEDRCHLNGMAVDSSGLRYLSALGETNTRDGWRENKAQGGCIIDYRSGKTVARGLSMPHSPRLFQNTLWILESGTGSFVSVDPLTGGRTTHVQLPGYARGLAFHSHYAFIGLSKIREKATFGGLPIETMHAELKCGIFIIDLRTMKEAGFIEFTKGIEELFDIHLLPDVTNPHIIGFEEDTINGVYVLP